MRPNDIVACPSGFVIPSFVNLKTNERMPFDGRHNTISYMAAEAMAAAFGGDQSYIPTKMGFIYGNTQNQTLQAISRSQSWDMLREELRNLDSPADVQVVDFSFQPTLTAGNGDSSSSDSEIISGSAYSNLLPAGSNAVVFHAHSNSTSKGALENDTVFSSGSASKYLYQAVLLGYHNYKYYILSRVDLSRDGSYLEKPNNFEVALDWAITFK